MHTLIAPTINLLILLAVLGHYLKEPLKAFVTGRHDSIREELHSVRDQLSGAKKKFAEFSAKLTALGEEVSRLKAQSKVDAEAMRQRVLADAKKLSVNIKADAQASAQSLYGELKGQLRHELGAQVLDRAEAILKTRLTGDDRVRIRQEFSMQLERAQ